VEYQQAWVQGLEPMAQVRRSSPHRRRVEREVLLPKVQVQKQEQEAQVQGAVNPWKAREGVPAGRVRPPCLLQR